MKLFKIIGVTLFLLTSYLFVQYVVAKRDAAEFVSNFKNYDSESAVEIYDRNDKLMFTFNKKNRIPVKLKDINSIIIYSVVAVEDRKFYQHKGVNYRSLGRASLSTIKGDTQGGSTITMQVVKNLTGDNERTLLRKLREIIFALELEKHYTKEEILERYLNEVYVGRNLYGVEAASKYYFGKTNESLGAEECVFIAGMLNAPEKYISSSIESRKRYLRRKEHILKRIREYLPNLYGYLVFIDADKLASPELQENIVSSQKPNSYALEEVRKYIYNKTDPDLIKRGLRVYTTFDSDYQRWGEEAVDRATNKFNDDQTQAALLAINPMTGEIYAVVGGKDFSKSEYNRAFLAKRQPGSSFKTFLYGAAFEAGNSPLTILEDWPTTIKMKKNYYTPVNNDGEYWGPLTAWEAMVNSRNVPAIRLNLKLSPSKMENYAKSAGIDSDIPRVPSAPLGAGTVTLKELTKAYGTISNLGAKTPDLYFISRIETKKGRVLEQNKPKEPAKVFSPDKTYELIETLRGVMDYGTGRRARIKAPAAGKTGTSSNREDAWFIGFTSRITCGVWVGRDDNKRISDNSEGGTVAAPLWADFMNKAITKTKIEELPLPIGITERKNFSPPSDLAKQIYSSRIDIRHKTRKSKPQVLVWN